MLTAFDDEPLLEQLGPLIFLFCLYIFAYWLPEAFVFFIFDCFAAIWRSIVLFAVGLYRRFLGLLFVLLYCTIAVALFIAITVRLLIILFVTTPFLYPESIWSWLFVVRLPRHRLKRDIQHAERGTRCGSLCLTCTELVSGSPLLTGSNALFTNPNETHQHLVKKNLQESRKSCHLCSLLTESSVSILEGERSPTTESGAERPAEQTESSPLLARMSVTVRRTQRLGYRSDLRVGLAVPDASSLQVGIVRPSETSTIQYDMNEAAVFRRAKGWIEFCKGHHPGCQKTIPFAEPFFLPSRLVRVIKSDGRVRAHLVETGETGETGLERSTSSPYLALSHCWGKSPTFITLNDQTLGDFKTEIPLSELPRNFQDAIEITARLEIHYIWIDSLCINQSLRNDRSRQAEWFQELSSMGRIYANAVCTISATASADAEGGCFYDREFFKADLILDTGASSSPVIKSRLSEPDGLSNIFDQKVELAPISRRGWTLQERVLSKRVLHFSSGLLLFECGTILASEYHPSGIQHERIEKSRAVVERTGIFETSAQQLLGSLNTVITRGVEFLKRNPGSSQESSLPGFISMRRAFQAMCFPRSDWSEKDMLEFHQRWMELVSPYSQRKLTEKTDKLVAVAGLARLVQESAGATFVAGLWDKTLTLNMLWMRQSAGKTRLEIKAPTWSWAIVDGPVTHRLTRDWPSIMAAKVNGFSSLRHLSYIPMHRDWLITDRRRDSGMTYSAVLTHNGVRLSTFLRPRGFSPGKQWSFIFTPDINIREEENLHLRLLSLVEIKIGNLEYEIHGIVIRPVDNQPGATYERVGHFSSDHYDTARYLTDGGFREYHGVIRLV